MLSAASSAVAKEPREGHPLTEDGDSGLIGSVYIAPGLVHALLVFFRGRSKRDEKSPIPRVFHPSKAGRRRALAIMGLEELKQRIHNFRMPIRNPRLLLAVKMVYLFTPVVLGYGVMQLVIPDPEELKKAMSPPSEAAAALTKHQKDGLRDVLEPARARHAQAQAQR